jgi:hypothetical protein
MKTSIQHFSFTVSEKVGNEGCHIVKNFVIFVGHLLLLSYALQGNTDELDM